jgi:acyl-CoA dehydrogenase
MGFWTDEQEDLRASARAYAQHEIAPHVEEWEAAGMLPRELHRKTAQQGFLGIGFAEEVGGEGGGQLDSLAVTEAFLEGGASSGLMAALFTHGIALPHIVSSGNAELIDRYVRPTLRGELIGSLGVTEPGGGSDVARLTTTARRDGDHYVVNGAKTFITSGMRADFVTTAVRTGGPGAGGLSLLVIDTSTPGFTRSGPLSKTGWRCSDTAELSFVDVRVPVANLVGAENAAFGLIAEHFIPERIALAVHAYGIGQRCLDATVAYVKERHTFGRAVVSRQVVQHRLVEMARRLDVARTYTREVARRTAAGEMPIAEALMAKSTAVEACLYAVDSAVQLHGGLGFMTGIEVERHARDARVLGIGGGTTEVLNDLTARLLGYTA